MRRALLIAILCVAAGLRIAAIGFGRNSLSFQPDEGYFNITLPLTLSWRDPNPHRFYYPAFLWYVLFAFDQAWFWIEKQFRLVHTDNLKQFFEVNPIPFFLLGRSVNAVIGTSTVGLLYLLGRRMARDAEALVAAAFLAVTYLHVRDSALATVEAPMTFFALLSLLGSAAVLHEGRTRDYALAGLAVGLATSAKYNAAVVLGALAIAHMLRGARDGVPLFRRLGSLRPYAAMALAVGTFLLLNPFLVLDWRGASIDLTQELVHQRLGQYGDVGCPWWYHLSVSLRFGMGALLLGLALAGAARTLWNRDTDGLVLLGFAAPFFMLMSSTHVAFARYMTPLLPVLCLFAAGAILRAGQIMRPGWPRATLIAAIILLAAAEPLWASLSYVRLVHATDTRVQAYRFVHASLPPHSKVASYGPTVVWKSTTPGLGNHVVHAQVPPGQTWADEIAILKRRNVRYFLTHHSELDLFSPTIPDLEEALRHSATLVAEFPFFSDKDPMPHPIYDEVDGFYFPIGRFRGVKRPGPLVRLYRLD